jgi:pimeloyl-ACP methyl ester carboxylesterase
MADFINKHRKSCLFTGLRILAYFGIGLIVLGIGLTIWQSWSSSNESLRFKPPGQFYDLGEFRLHLYCTGSGSPALILEGGLGSPGEMWARVQPELAKNHQVCSYDRAGLGWSDASPEPRTVQNIVDELDSLLSRSKISGPYVLVGHSFGGYIVRVYAKKYPAEVAGIVLVGAGHEDFARRMPSGCEAIAQSNISFGQLAQTLSQFGIIRMAGDLGLLSPLTGDMLKGVPPELQLELSALTFYKPQFWKTYVAEMSSLPESEAQVRSTGTLGDLPLVVLSGNPDVSRVPKGCQAASVVALSKELQVELANLSSHSEHIVCEQCGHYIPLSDPQLVVDAVGRLIEALNSQTK